MGSYITLGIEQMEIDTGKNDLFNDYSPLFQKCDKKNVPYYTGTEITFHKGYSKKLSLVKKRLDLLGYTIQNLEKIFLKEMDTLEKYGIEIEIDYTDFYDSIYNLDIRNINYIPQGKNDFETIINLEIDLGKHFNKLLKNSSEFKNKLIELLYNSNELSNFFECIDSYFILRILSENPNNDDLNLIWRTHDIIEGGWVDENDIWKPLCEDNKIMIVTEGSTDSFILEKTINKFFPSISDFFTFIDMKENYPFTGVGNLYNFCKGLTKINIQNNVLVIFDNDTAGLEKFEESKLLKKNRNLKIIKLPEHKDFNTFKTKGPNGDFLSNINGRAVTIECFLDFKQISNGDIFIRWTSYNKALNQYQGEISQKKDLFNAFKNSINKDTDYDYTRLIYLVEYIIETWIS